MTTSAADRTTVHAETRVERVYRAPPARVFAAFASAEAVTVWARPGDGFTVEVAPFDFRVDGQSVTRMTLADQPPWISTDRFHDIVPDRRIIQSTVLHREGLLMYAGLVTIDFQAVNGGCRLLVVEQGTFPDGRDRPEMHAEGWELVLANIAAYLDA